MKIRSAGVTTGMAALTLLATACGGLKNAGIRFFPDGYGVSAAGAIRRRESAGRIVEVSSCAAR